MPDILLIDTNTTPFNEAFPVYPIGLDYLQGALNDAGLGPVEVLDLTRAGGPLGREALSLRGGRSLDLIRQKLAEKPWDLVGLSLRNLDSTYPILDGPAELHYYLPQLSQYLDCVATHADPRTRVVLGGTGFSIMPEAFLVGRPDTWHGVVGPGEGVLVELARGILAGVDQPRLTKANGRDTAIGRLQNRALLGAYLDLPQGEGSFGLRSKTGCGQACGYCPYPLINGPKQNLKDPAEVVEELRLLSEVHARHPARPPLRFMFADDIFNRPLDHAKAILKAMLAAGIRPDAWHAYLDPSGLDREFFELALASGGWSRPGPEGLDGRVMFFPFDVESGSDRILAKLGKPYRAKDVLAGVEAWRAVSGAAVARGELAAAGLGFHLLLGYPGEDEASIAETCRLVNQAQPDQVAVQLAVRVYPGTPLARQTKEQLWQREEDLRRPVFAPIDEDQIMTWLRRHLDAAYDRLARRGNMLLIGRGD